MVAILFYGELVVRIRDVGGWTPRWMVYREKLLMREMILWDCTRQNQSEACWLANCSTCTLQSSRITIFTSKKQVQKSNGLNKKKKAGARLNGLNNARKSPPSRTRGHRDVHLLLMNMPAHDCSSALELVIAPKLLKSPLKFNLGPFVPFWRVCGEGLAPGLFQMVYVCGRHTADGWLLNGLT